MPGFKNFVELQIVRGVRAFLRLEGGVVRGELPRNKRERKREAGRKDQEISRLKHELAKANKQLSRLEPKKNVGIARRDDELGDLRQRVDTVESGRFRLSGGRRWNSREEVPAFFVVGGAKSGTSWLASLLNSHPEILCRGEGRFFGRETVWGDPSIWQDPVRVSRAARVSSANAAPTTLQYALWHDELLRLWLERSPWARRDGPEEHLKNLTRLATNYFLTEGLATARHQTKHMVGDKTPLKSADILREIFEVYPEAKVIHIIRDGRDRAVSRIHQFWRNEQRGGLELDPESVRKRDAYHADKKRFGPSGESIFTEGQIKTFASEWREWVGRSVEDGPALLGSDYEEVRYEDLLAQPEKVRRLFEFLGASSEKDTVDHCIEVNSFEKLSGRKPGEEPQGVEFKKRRKGIAGDWENVFTERDKAIFKEEAGDLLVQLGYERDADW